MKRFLVALMALVIGFSLICTSAIAISDTAGAEETLSADNGNTVSTDSTKLLSNTEKFDLSQLPIYITIVTEGYDEHCTTSTQNSCSNKNTLSNAEKENLWNNKLFIPTLERVKELVDEGVAVSYVNFKIPSAANTYSNDPNDPAYWESVSVSLGNLNGYHFRYMESEVGVRSSEVEVTSMSGVKWGEVSMAAIKGLVQMAVGNISQSASWFTYFSDVFKAAQVPLNITYDSKNEYVRYRAIGTLYMRVILIQDKDDKVPGYAYYDWGLTELFDVDNHVTIKYPTSYRDATQTTKNYESFSKKVSDSVVTTPGFYGNITLFRKLIDCYNANGRVLHEEVINVNTTVTSLFRG